MLCDQAYADLISTALGTGTKITTRNSRSYRTHSRLCTFAKTPLIHARKTAWKTALREWAFFMSGSDNINTMHPSVRPWWEPWADANGKIANTYSKQFRSSNGAIDNPDTSAEMTHVWIDQIQYLIDGVKNHPFSRRNVITTWNTAEMVDPSTKLTNCHGTVIQAFVNPEDNTLDLTTYQRSSDVIVGLGANWVQYWGFLMWLAHRTGRAVGKLTWIGGDVHVYEEHEDLARKILDVQYRVHELAGKGALPELVYRPTSDDFLADDFSLTCEYSPVLSDKALMVV